MEDVSMKLSIIVNKYLLIWHLLYQSSVSDEIHRLKQKLWQDHKKEYASIHRDKILILSSPLDFIPDDDYIYNMVESSIYYKKLKQETNKYRLNVMEVWDKNRKKYNEELEKLFKTDLDCSYDICVIHPSLDVVESDLSTKTLTIGKRLILKDKDNFLTYVVYKIVKNEFNNIKTADRDIVDAITELLITNELYTRITRESKYNLGKKSLKEIKHKIYPYFLMYLGVNKNDFEKYMIRDNIFFNINNYNYISYLKNIDIYSFIDFIIKSKESILGIKDLNDSVIEVL